MTEGFDGTCMQDAAPAPQETPDVEVTMLGQDLLEAEATGEGGWLNVGGKPHFASAFFRQAADGGWMMETGTGTCHTVGTDGRLATEETGDAAAAAFALLGRGVALHEHRRAADAVARQEECLVDIEAKADAARAALAGLRAAASRTSVLLAASGGALPPETGAKETRAPFQVRVGSWMEACFGPDAVVEVRERSHRHLEEALELSQACGCTAEEAAQLVAYVYGRPAGDRAKEAGGALITLAALCVGIGADMESEGERELARVWAMAERIRAKRDSRPEGSPLPGT